MQALQRLTLCIAGKPAPTGAEWFRALLQNPMLTISRIQSRCYDEFLAQFHLEFPQVEFEDINVYLLWNREQKLTRAESVFLERFEQMLMVTDMAERF